jgi:hypothetical protein
MGVNTRKKEVMGKTIIIFLLISVINAIFHSYWKHHMILTICMKSAMQNWRLLEDGFIIND